MSSVARDEYIQLSLSMISKPSSEANEDYFALKFGNKYNRLLVTIALKRIVDLEFGSFETVHSIINRQ